MTLFISKPGDRISLEAAARAAFKALGIAESEERFSSKGTPMIELDEKKIAETLAECAFDVFVPMGKWGRADWDRKGDASRSKNRPRQAP